MRHAFKSFLPGFLLFGLLQPAVCAPRSAKSKPKGEAIAGFAKYVNPFIGTAGADMANTFPGVALPFGMIQWSPDTLRGSHRMDLAKGATFTATTRSAGSASRT